MDSRMAFAVLAALTIGGLAQAQPPPTPPAESALPPAMASPPLDAAPEVMAPLCAAPDPVCTRFWTDGEFLVWWMTGVSVPPLITTSPAGTDPAQAGVFGNPGTAILFGDRHYNGNARSGVRVTGGFWFDEARTLGTEVQYLVLESKSATFFASSNGNPILAQPFLTPGTNQPQPTASPIAVPDVVTGSVRVNVTTSGLTGLEALARETIVARPAWRVDLIGGYRYLHFTERVSVTSSMTTLSTNNRFGAAAGSAVVVGDEFDTKNEFQGFEIGLDAEFRRDRWAFHAIGKIALGWDYEVKEVNGNTTVTEPGTAPVTTVGGLLAQATNIGGRSKHKLAGIPELDLDLSYQLTPRIQLHAGYTLLEWGETVRAGNIIDTNVTLPTPGATSTTPRQLFPSTPLFVHGLNFGVEMRF